MSSRAEILMEVIEERKRQLTKWGEQRHPDYPPTLGIHPRAAGVDFAPAIHRYFGIPTEATAKAAVNIEASQGTSNWPSIALEEFCEAIGAVASGDRAALRKELIQTMAVLCSWVEDLDSRPNDDAGPCRV